MAMDVGGGEKSRLGMAKPEMNVTPLVDVVLVLLIIFMVVTPMLTKQFWVHLPNEPDKEAPPPPPSDDGPVVVTVTEDGTIRINRDEVPIQDLARKLKRVLAAKGQRTAFFDADDDASFGIAAEVLDTMRGGGAATIAVLTEAIKK